MNESIVSIIHPEPNFKRSTLEMPTEIMGDKSNFPREGEITVTQDFLIEPSGSFTRVNIMPEKFNGSLLDQHTASIRPTETSVKVEANIGENPNDDTKPIDPFLESSIRQPAGGSQ